jgi:hypothetical protein
MLSFGDDNTKRGEGARERPQNETVERRKKVASNKKVVFLRRSSDLGASRKISFGT